MTALTASCLICVFWFSASSGSAISGREHHADVLSASASTAGHIKTDGVTEERVDFKKSALTRMVKRSLQPPDAMKEIQAKPPIPKGVKLINSAKMKAYLQKEKRYEAEEKKKEQFFLRKQKNEAFMAETVAKQTARKYNILTFPDKNMKRLTDFVEKKFPLPNHGESHGQATNAHRIVGRSAAESHGSPEPVSHSHLAQADSERIHTLASQKKHGLTKLAPAPQISSSEADASGNEPTLPTPTFVQSN